MTQPPQTSAADTQPMRPWTLLCVDDESSILAALRRVFRTEGCRILVAGSGAEALTLLEAEKVTVVISDMRMPGMDGARLLAIVRERWPDTARVLLTGYADMDSTIQAINEGQIYRYIQKPWDEHELRLTVRQAAERQMLEQERGRLQALTDAQNAELLVLNTGLENKVAERTAELSRANERLKANYLSTIRVFTGLLEMRSGSLAGHGKRVADLARRIAVTLEIPSNQVQEIVVAALLHDMGFMAVPDTLLGKPVGRYEPDERIDYQRHPVLGSQVLMGLEDMQSVAQLIRSHHERYDGKGYPDKIAGADIALGSRIIAVADTWDDLIHGHLTGAQIKENEARLLLQRARGTQFDPAVVDVVLNLTREETVKTAKLRQFAAEALQPGMVLGKDLKTPEGIVLLASGQKLTPGLVERIQRYSLSENRKIELSIQY